MQPGADEAEVSSTLHVRQATEADAAGILRCLAAAFGLHQSEYTPDAFSDTVLTPDRLSARMQEMHVLVALSEGRVSGTVAGAVGLAGEGHLRGMAVLPSDRGSGVAACLLREIENWLRTQGCNCVTLDTTLPLQAAMKFYEKHGYRRSGRVTDFFGMPLLEYRKDFSKSLI